MRKKVFRNGIVNGMTIYFRDAFLFSQIIRNKNGFIGSISYSVKKKFFENSRFNRTFMDMIDYFFAHQFSCKSSTKRQYSIQEEAKRNLDKLLCFDTDLLTIKIWSEYKYGSCDPWIEEKIKFNKDVKAKEIFKIFAISFLVGIVFYVFQIIMA